MTATSSGTRIWDTISRRPIDELDLTEPTRTLIERASSSARCPCAPGDLHRHASSGSAPHDQSGRQLAARFVTLPVDVLGAATDLLEGNADAILLDPRRPRFGSIYDLRLGNPFLEALVATPIAPGIAAHSIIPQGARGRRERDRWRCPIRARLDGVESELVIPFSGHSVRHRVTVEEVRRILLEHAMVVCRASGIACALPRRAKRRGHDEVDDRA